MVTWTKKVRQGEDANGAPLFYCEGFCLSTDTLPVDFMANGSNVLESDLGNVRVFDQENRRWIAFGGSGPSGSLSITANGTYDVMNKAEVVVNVPETVAFVRGVHTPESTVTCTKDDMVFTSEAGDRYVFSLPEIGTYTVDCGADSRSVVVNDLGTTHTEDFAALIYVDYPPGSIVTCVKGSTTLTSDDSGRYVFHVTETGDWTLSCGDSIGTISVSELGDTYTVDMTFKIVPWSTGADYDISAMIRAAHAGDIDLRRDAGWAVGDVRTIEIAAFTGGGNVAHAAQSVDIVISSFDDYMNCGCVMQFDFKDALAESQRMNSTDTNVGGYGATEMKTTTLPALVNALPTWLKDRLIEFSVLASIGNKSTTIETVTGNKLALRSEFENGLSNYSIAHEGTTLTYYTTTANRKKKKGHSGAIDIWWTRSSCTQDSKSFCLITSSGSSFALDANSSSGNLAPFGCL